MALLNLLLIPILAALGLFETASGDGGGAAGDGGASDSGKSGSGSGTPGNQGAQGGSGAAAAGAGGSAGSAPAQAAGNGSAGKAAGDGQAPAGGQAPPQQGTSLTDIETLQRELNEARAEAGKYRAAGIQAVAAALGIELPRTKGEEGQEAAIAQLQKEINSLRDENRRNAIDAAFERAVSKVGARPVLTRRYVADQLADLDPKADDFATQLEQIVQAAIDEEPALKAAQATAVSGGEFNGEGGGTSEYASMSIDDLRKERAKWRGDAAVH